MTAEAIKGDRELCLAAGMDGYVSKPIDQQALYDAIDQWPAGVLSAIADEIPHPPLGPVAERTLASSPFAPPPAATADHSSSDEGVIDWNVAKERVGGDNQLLSELVVLVKTEWPQLLSDIRRALETSDARLLRRSGHTLRSSANLFGSRLVSEQAQRMEMLGREENLDDAPTSLPTLEVEVTRFLAAVEQYSA